MREGNASLGSTRRTRLVIAAAILLMALLPQTVLAAPAAVNANPQARGYSTHVVQAGETLAGIAAQYGVSLQSLIDANNIANANIIYIGQRLRVPTGGGQSTGTPTTGGCARTHSVVAGETLSGIAVDYGVTIQSLAQANDVTVTSYVYIGQQLCIPGSSSGGGGTSGGGGGGGSPTRTGGFWYEVLNRRYTEPHCLQQRHHN